MSSAPNSFDANFLCTPGTSTDVEMYFKVLLLESDRAKLSVKDLERLRVISAGLVKSKRGAQHEYVSAKVVEPEGASFYLAVERFQGEKIIPENDTKSQKTRVSVDNEVPRVPAPTAQSKSDSHILPASIRHSSDSSSPEKHAVDKITYLNSAREGLHSLKDDELYRRDLSDSSTERPFYLYELVVLAKLLHDIDPKYLIQNTQCYFYAGTIMQALETVCGVAQSDTVNDDDDDVVNTGDSTTGDNKIESLNAKPGKKKSNKNKAGKWNGLQIHSPLSDKKMKTLVERFDIEVKAFRQKVIDFNNAEEEKRAEIERQKMAAVEEERQQKIAAMAAAEEERQKNAAMQEQMRAMQEELARLRRQPGNSTAA